jgi:hypothetical protein
MATFAMQLKFYHWLPTISFQQPPQPSLSLRCSGLSDTVRFSRTYCPRHRMVSSGRSFLYSIYTLILDTINIITMLRSRTLMSLRNFAAHKARSAKSLPWVLVTDPGSYRIHHLQAARLLTCLLGAESRLSIRLQLRLEMTPL